MAVYPFLYAVVFPHNPWGIFQSNQNEIVIPSVAEKRGAKFLHLQNIVGLGLSYYPIPLLFSTANTVHVTY